MGDRTYHQAYVYDCPPEKVGIVLDILEKHGFSLPYDNGTTEVQLCLDEQYHIEEAYLGTSLEFASELIEKAPEVSFGVWEDPKYEFLRQGVMYAPGPGRFDYNCGSEGDPVFTSDEVQKILEANTDERAKLLGTPWQTAFAALGDRRGVVLNRSSEEGS